MERLFKALNLSVDLKVPTSSKSKEEEREVNTTKRFDLRVRL